MDKGILESKKEEENPIQENLDNNIIFNKQACQNYFIIQCVSCSNLLSRTIKKEFLTEEEKKRFSYINYPFLTSIKTSKEANIETLNEGKDYYVYKKVSCLLCRNKLGKYIIASSPNCYYKLEKVKLDSKECNL